MFLVSVLPYIVPFVAMIYPMAVTYGALRNTPKDPEAEDLSADDLEGEQRKDDLRCGLQEVTSHNFQCNDRFLHVRTRATLALTIAATYVATHLPLAVTALVTYPLMARGDVYLDWPTLCQVVCRYEN